MKEINDELTYKIIGCAMKVHNTLGNGFQEVIYQRCLAIELAKQGLQFLRERAMPIYYHDKLVGKRRADFIVGNSVLSLNYLEAYKIEKGLLINFGSASMEVKRLFRKQKQNPAHSKSQALNPDHPDSDN